MNLSDYQGSTRGSALNSQELSPKALLNQSVTLTFRYQRWILLFRVLIWITALVNLQEDRLASWIRDWYYWFQYLFFLYPFLSNIILLKQKNLQLLCLLDTLFITVLVKITGGIYSPFLILFFMPVVIISVFGNLRAGIEMSVLILLWVTYISLDQIHPLPDIIHLVSPPRFFLSSILGWLRSLIFSEGFGTFAILLMILPLLFNSLRTQTRLTRCLILLRRRNEALKRKMKKQTWELEEVHKEMLSRLSLALEYRDKTTRDHIQRMSDLSAMIARELGLPEREVELIQQCAPLHDIGKVGVPDFILLKPKALSSEEWEVIKTHPLLGARILHGGRSSLLQKAVEIVLTHHERWDGTGYPLGLKGEEIPLSGRIVALSDVFDALLSPRPYKPPWTMEEALREIQNQRGKHFDPQVVDAFLRLVERGEVYNIYSSDLKKESIDSMGGGRLLNRDF